MLIKVRVLAGSRENNIEKLEKNYYKVKLSQPPEKGRANNQLKLVLADYFKVSKNNIKILKGHTNPLKLIEVF